MTSAHAAGSVVPRRSSGPRELAAIRGARGRLESYMEGSGLAGWDPFDALRSPLFRAPPLRDARRARFAAQQLVRRSPVNLRPLLRVPKGVSPVTLALVAEANARLAASSPAGAERRLATVERCLDELERLRSAGWSGACWGYEFDWEARYARMPAHCPTVVATGLVTNALFGVFEALGAGRALELCVSATRFVRRDLARTAGGGGSFCWSYSPHDRTAVLNATLKGARLCAQVFSVTGEPALRREALASARFVVERQRPDGAWPYAVGDARRWVDNFHTAYVLDCLDEVERRAAAGELRPAAERGWAYYRSRFLAQERVPKYLDRRLYPVDATSCAQSIVTLLRFRDVDAARRVAAWTIARMQAPDGSFAYQVRRSGTVRTPFMRWSCATMLSALVALELELAA